MSKPQTCPICLKEKAALTYTCCRQPVCQNCQVTWHQITEKCPFCRQPVVLNYTIPEGPLEKRFSEFLAEHQITSDYHIKRARRFISEIQRVLQVSRKPVYFQVANLKLIHVFKYNNLDQLTFKYHPTYQSIEVLGGQYYQYGKIKDSNFGWWLHGYIRQVENY